MARERSKILLVSLVSACVLTLVGSVFVSWQFYRTVIERNQARLASQAKEHVKIIAELHRLSGDAEQTILSYRRIAAEASTKSRKFVIDRGILPSKASGDQLVLVEPIKELGMNLIAAVDRSSVLEPVRRLWTICFSVLAILAGFTVVIWRRSVNGIIRRLEDAEHDLISSRERAEAATREKSSFVSQMSHEIRTPLSAITGYCEILQKDHTASKSARIHCEALRRNALHLASLIDDVLDLSKIESGKMEVHRRVVDLTSELETVVGTFEQRAQEKEIEFGVEVVGRIPKQIYTDPTKFRQILINTIGNAFKFTDQGFIKVAVSLRGNVGAGDRGDAILAIEVRDSGCGIKAHAHETIFEPFQQARADDHAEDVLKGTGLGLSLSKRLARELGGDLVLVESQPGVGTTFLASVGIGQASDATPMMSRFSPLKAKDDSEHQTTDLTGVKVLVIDDSADLCTIAKLFLESQGANVMESASGEAGLKILRDRAFDVILVDIQMPGMDGFEVVSEMRRAGYEKPVIAVTATATKKEYQRCREVGFSDFLAKPYSKDVLVSMLAKWSHP